MATKPSTRSRTSTSKPKAKPKAKPRKKAPVVASLQGRQRPSDVNKDNAEAENQQQGPLQPPEDKKAEGKPDVDLHAALQTLRDGVHPGTPYGYVHDGVTQRDRLGVPYINAKEASGLEKKGLATISDSTIRPV